MTDSSTAFLPPPRCWKTIGVFSRRKPTCDELTRVVHCRNCEVYTQAGRTLLEQPIPDACREEWGRIIAEEKKEEAPGTVSVVIFRLAEEWFALRTRIFDEIIDREPRHGLPHNRNPVFLGIVNVHGEIRWCVSLQDLLEIKPMEGGTADRKAYRRMMVITGEEGTFVAPVDEIHGIHRIDPARFENVPATIAKARQTYTRHIFQWNGLFVALLDEERLLKTLSRSIQ